MKLQTQTQAKAIQPSLREAEPMNLVEELYQFAVAHAKGSANQPSEADDFLQEILIVFLEVNRRYNLPKVELIKVAKTAARNRIRDLIRKRAVRLKYHVRIEDVGSAEATYSEERLRVAIDTLRFIERHISERAALALRLTRDGLTTSEAALILECKEESVRGLLDEAKIAGYIHDLQA